MTHARARVKADAALLDGDDKKMLAALKDRKGGTKKRPAAAIDVPKANVMKRPAALVIDVDVPKAKVMKRPAALVIEVGCKKPAPPVPTADYKPPKVVYKDAWVYTSMSKQCYRCILNPRENVSDKPFPWRGSSNGAAWAACLAYIDGQRKTGKK